MRSIRLFLVASILATLILFNFVAALQGYRSSMEQADIVFDEQLQNIAQLVMGLDLDLLSSDLNLQNGMSFQIWQDGTLVANSSNAPSIAMSDFEAGFSYTNFAGYRWRSFVIQNIDLDRWVLVAERSDLRFVLAENVVLESILPILLGIPLVGLLIWSIVSLGLRPLQLLSTELREKQAYDLSPIGNESPSKELEQVVESTNQFILRLGEVLEREKRFSADAAHELRTPISALKIQLHNLADEIDPQSESYRQLQRGVERMQHLIEQLLSLYRTTPEKFAENKHEVNLTQLVQNQIAQMYSRFEAKQQNLELEAADINIEGDEFALETLISNLLSNANKYTDAGGDIRIHIEDTPTAVTLGVADSGVGIAIEDRDRVFDRFYRSDFAAEKYSAGDRTKLENIPGCGLGLTIVSHIAKLHDGELSIEDSGLGSGVVFKVCFNKTKQ